MLRPEGRGRNERTQCRDASRIHVVVSRTTRQTARGREGQKQITVRVLEEPPKQFSVRDISK